MTRKRVTIGLLMVAVLAASLLIPGIRYWLVNNAGRWHIVLLHFPIGLLVLAGLLELLQKFGLPGITREVMRYILGLGAVAAIAAAATGLVLHEQGGYDLELVEWHERLGIATTLASLITFYLHATGKMLAYHISLAVTVILLTIAGHYGGSLTHGEGFLTEELSNWEEQRPKTLTTVAFEEAQVWEHLIQPVLEEKCVSCHNTGKQKGGLVLLDSAAIHRGGEHGDVLGVEKETSIYAVIGWPLEHEMHMPPKGKAQLSEEEQALIRWWIEQQAPFQQQLAKLELEPEMVAMLRERLAPADPIDLLGIEPVAAADLEQLQQAGYRIQSLDPAKPWLAVNLSDLPNLSEDDLDQLEDLQSNITHLDLGNSNVSGEVLEWTANCAQLQELKLDQCKLEAEDLAVLSELEHLEYLNLYGAQLTEGGESVLAQFTQLERLYLWNTSLPKASIETLRQQLDSVEVIADSPGDDFPKQPMIAPEFASKSIFLKRGEVYPISCRYPGVEIRYTLDGTEPLPESPLFTAETQFQQSGKIRARSYLDGWDPSPVVEQTFLDPWPGQVSVVKADAGDEKYPGKAEAGLTDQLVGEPAITDEQWIGRWGKNFEVVLDLGREEAISGIAVHALEDVKSWVFFPKAISVSGGSTLSSLKRVSRVAFDETNQLQAGKGALFQVPVSEPVRYVRIQVESYGKLPEWHESAGQPSWLFVDEVAVY